MGTFSGRRRASLLAAALTATGVAAAPMAPALAADLPGGAAYYVQTNGRSAAIGLGDYYTATTGGATDHQLRLYIPCSWPAGKPVHVDLYGAEVTSHASVQSLSEEPSAPLDSARFVLTGPTGPAASRTYQPTAAPEAWTRLHTIPDGRAACGTWTLSSELLTAGADPLNPASNGNDQNGWRLRVAGDNDADPGNPPPADADNPDGIAGTDDEILLGLERITFQHDAGAVVCQTFWSYVAPGEPTARFHNFDMDGNGRVRYYPPGSVIDPTATSGGIAGTASANARWNGSAGVTRVGDTIASPATGWWAIVSCISNHNQLIQEGVNSGVLFMSQPPTPRLSVTKSDGVADLIAGSTSTYAIRVSNVSDADTAPGAARQVTVTDPLPAPLGFVSCAVRAPAAGSCSESSGTVTAVIDGAVPAGGSAVVDITVSVPAGAPAGPISNTATVAFTDSYGNRFSPIQAVDTGTVVRPADVTITAALDGPLYSGRPLSLLLTVGNEGPESAADPTVSGPIPAGFSVTGFTAPGWSCSTGPGTWTCARGAPLGAGSSEQIEVLGTVTAAAGDPVAFAATIGTTTVELDLTDNSAGVADTAVPFPADVRVTATLLDSVEAGETNRLAITVGSEGLDDAAGVTVGGALPAGFSGASIEAPGWTCALLPSSWSCARDSVFPTGAADETLIINGLVTAGGGDPLVFPVAVATTTTEVDLIDNAVQVNETVKALAVTALPVCRNNVPWLEIATVTQGFTAGTGDTATVTWQRLTGETVRVDTAALNDRLLWPGAAVDALGNGTDWPGWDLVDGQWVEVDDGLDQTLRVLVSVNPTAAVLVTYPEATAACTAAPPVAAVDPGSQGSGGADPGSEGPAVAGDRLASTGAAPIAAWACLGMLLIAAGRLLRRVAR